MLVQSSWQTMTSQNFRRAKFYQRWRSDAILEGVALALAVVVVVEEAVVMLDCLQCLNGTATGEARGLER